MTNVWIVVARDKNATPEDAPFVAACSSELKAKALAYEQGGIYDQAIAFETVIDGIDGEADYADVTTVL